MDDADLLSLLPGKSSDFFDFFSDFMTFISFFLYKQTLIRLSFFSPRDFPLRFLLDGILELFVFSHPPTSFPSSSRFLKLSRKDKLSERSNRSNDIIRADLSIFSF